MPTMTDPTPALESFQEALSSGAIRITPSPSDPALFMHLDDAEGVTRFTYVRLERTIVTALVMFALVDRLEDGPRFQIGYAVPERCRSKGRAKEIVKAAIADLKQGMAHNGISKFSVEAVVGKDNAASMRVAAATLSGSPTDIMDSVSGLPALYYLRNVE